MPSPNKRNMRSSNKKIMRSPNKKNMRSPNKKNMARLNDEQRARLQEERDRKQVGHFLMPDAPPNKKRRTISPVRVPCPLVPGTPEKPPLRIRQPWELEKLALEGMLDGPSRVVLEEDAATPPPSMENQLIIIPSTPVIIAEQVDETLVVNSSIELVWFEPSTSFSAESSTLQILSPGPSTSTPGLETPLHPRKKRTWEPSDEQEQQPSTSWAMVPSPDLFIECETGTPAPPAPRPRQNLRDPEVMDYLHYGSEPDSDDSGDDEARPRVLPRARTVQIILDTPLDTDFGDGGDDDADAAEPGVPAAQPAAADIPLMATDQPRRWFDFEWEEFPNPPVLPESRRETFSQINVGPTTPRDDPYAIFLDIWDRPIMEHIACETNKYVQQVAAKMFSGDLDSHLHPNSRINRWKKDTTPEELYTFFGLLLAMGVVVKTRLEEYWSASSDIFCTPGFSAHMPIDRFLLLSRFIHFNDVSGMCGLNLTRSQAKLFKIQPILDHVNKKFQDLYTLSQNIAVDESLLMWKGWLDIGQLIPNKKAKRGIKTYELCESQTGYLWRFEVHAHKKSLLPPPQFEDPMEASTPSIVLRLTQGLEHKGYTLWMDNFYNSPCLARRLKSLGFDCVGTLRTDRKFVPPALHRLTKWDMVEGQIAGLTSGDVDVMVWKDYNRVATISTYHGPAVQETRGSIKPILVLDYNIMMGGVDKKDQLLAMYPVERKRTTVWYKKLFQRLLNSSVINSYIIHRQSTSSSLSHRNFRIALIKSLLSRHRPHIAPIASTQNRKLGESLSRDALPFEAAIHRISENPLVLQSSGKSQRKRRLCVQCRKKTTMFCVGCNVSMCMDICFVARHPPIH